MPEGVKTDNFIMRVYLETIENIVGPHGLTSILNYNGLGKYINNFPPDNDEVGIPEQDLRNLYLSLIELFGQKGARGLQLQVGRENVRRGLEKLPRTAKAMQLAAFLVPESKKMRIGLEKLMETVAQRTVYPTDEKNPFLELREGQDCFIIIYRNYWESKDVVSQSPVCGIFVGILDALMEWMTGHRHEVEEIECKAMGCPYDAFRVLKAPRKV